MRVSACSWGHDRRAVAASATAGTRTCALRFAHVRSFFDGPADRIFRAWVQYYVLHELSRVAGVVASWPESMKALHILILFVGVFIAFTPFEWPGTHYAVIIGVLLPVAAFAVVAPTSTITSIIQPNVAWALVGYALFHMLLIQPVPFDMAIGLLAAALAGAAMARFGYNHQRTLAHVFALVVGVHLAGLLVQGLAYFATGEVASLHRLIFPMSQDRTGFALAGVVRFGGFQLEPGTYSAWMAMLIVVLRTWRGRFGILEAVGVLSILATYSAAGIAFVVVLGLWACADVFRAGRFADVALGIGAVIAIAAVALYLGMGDYLVERFYHSTDDYSVSIREQPVIDWLSLDTVDKVIGAGFKEAECEVCPRELGFGFLFLTSGGVGSVLVLAFYVAVLVAGSSRRQVVDILFALLIVLMVKAAPSNVAPWVLLFTLADRNLQIRRHVWAGPLAHGAGQLGGLPRA